MWYKPTSKRKCAILISSVECFSKEEGNLGLAARSSRLLGLENLIGVSDLHQTLQQQSIRHLCANITVFTGAVALQEILALPSIIFDLHCGHTIEPLFALSLSPNRLKARVTSRQNSQ